MGWVTAIGAVAGAYGSHQQAKAARAGSKNAGQVNINRNQTPWEPSQGYREAGMARAAQLLGRTPFWEQQQPQQGSRRGGRRGGGRGGGGAQQPGMTDQLLRGLSDRAQGGHVLYDPANQFVQGTMAGDDQNPYRQDIYGDLQGYSPDRINAFQDRLLGGDLEGLFGDGGQSSGRGGGYGGGVAVQQVNFDPEDPVGAARYAREILDGKYLNEGNPYSSRMIDAITNRSRQEFQDTVVPGLATDAIGSGMFSSGVFANALANAQNQHGRDLNDTVSGVLYQDYNNRMGDVMGALDIGAGLDTASWNNQTQLMAENMAGNRAAQGASASYAAAGADRDSRERMAQLDAMVELLGMGSQAEQFGLAGRMGLAQGFSDDQMGALGSVGELSGLGLRDYGMALDASQRRDEFNQRRDSERAANSRYRDERDYNRRMQQHNQGFLDAAAYADLINAMSGGYGNTSEIGYDQRGVSPSNISPTAQAISGALGGAYAGNQFASMYRDYRGGRQAPPPTNYSNWYNPANTYSGGSQVPPQWQGSY